MNDLYMAREGVQYGPFGLDKVRELIAQRQLIGTDLVWCPGMPSWQLASEVLAELLPRPAPTPPAVPVISPSAVAATSTAPAAQATSPVAAPSSYQLPAYSPDAVSGQSKAVTG